MKIKLLLCVILVGCTFGFAKEKANVPDVTGCLSKGDSAKEFLLTGNDGSTWEVHSSRVALAEHVGHTASWGYYPSGGLGLVLLIGVILALAGRL
jgi:Protein of unknown function (DUF3309)